MDTGLLFGAVRGPRRHPSGSKLCPRRGRASTGRAIQSFSRLFELSRSARQNAPAASTRPSGNHPLERDDFSLNRQPALAFCLSMIFSENRCTLFGIMLSPGCRKSRYTALPDLGQPALLREIGLRCRGPEQLTRLGLVVGDRGHGDVSVPQPLRIMFDAQIEAPQPQVQPNPAHLVHGSLNEVLRIEAPRRLDREAR